MAIITKVHFRDGCATNNDESSHEREYCFKKTSIFCSKEGYACSKNVNHNAFIVADTFILRKSCRTIPAYVFHSCLAISFPFSLILFLSLLLLILFLSLSLLLFL